MKGYRDIDMIHYFIGEMTGITPDKNDIHITNEIRVPVDGNSINME
jgi:hypothetical protein